MQLPTIAAMHSAPPAQPQLLTVFLDKAIQCWQQLANKVELLEKLNPNAIKQLRQIPLQHKSRAGLSYLQQCVLQLDVPVDHTPPVAVVQPND
jgi:hypothetical protein